MANSNLTNAKRARNDEFYTQYHDIEKEVTAYIEYNSDVFRGKTILLPCDDPQYNKNKATKNGKIFTLTRDKSGDGKIDVGDLKWKYLKG